LQCEKVNFVGPALVPRKARRGREASKDGLQRENTKMKELTQKRKGIKCRRCQAKTGGEGELQEERQQRGRTKEQREGKGTG
jgi:hypothetical protein